MEAAEDRLKDEQRKQEAAEWNSKGVEYYNAGNYEKAVECFKKAAELCPDDDIYRKNLEAAEKALYSGYFQHTVDFTYKRGEYTVKYSISKYSYHEYQEKERPSNPDYWGKMVTYNEPEIKELAKCFIDYGNKNGLTKNQVAELVVAFVQALPYVPDSVSSGRDEYPKYPVETLAERGGDCEDTSILTAAILRAMNYDVVLFELPGHMAVGIWGDNIPGTYVEYNGKKYYYLETTGENWEVGQIPKEYQNSKVRVIPIQ